MELIIPATPAKGEKFGTENLKSWIDFTARLAKHAQEVAADRKISWLEALSSLPLLRELFTKIQSFEQLFAEIRDLSAAEERELINITGQVFNFRPDKAAQAYTDIVLRVLHIGNYFQKLIQTAQNLL